MKRIVLYVYIYINTFILICVNMFVCVCVLAENCWVGKCLKTICWIYKSLRLWQRDTLSPVRVNHYLVNSEYSDPDQFILINSRPVLMDQSQIDSD